MISLIHKDLKSAIELHYDRVNTIVIENQTMFRQFVLDIEYSISSHDSAVSFFRDGEILKSTSSIEFVDSLMKIDVDKKIKTLLIKKITHLISQDIAAYTNKYLDIVRDVNEILFTLDNSVIVDDELDVSALIKLLNPKFDIHDEGLIEQLIKYVDILVEYSNLKVIALLGACDYLSQEEMNAFTYHCRNREVSILLIQPTRRYKINEEHCMIIDDDLCEIIVSSKNL